MSEVYRELFQRFGSVPLIALLIAILAFKASRASKHRFVRVLSRTLMILALLVALSAALLPFHLPVDRIVFGRLANDPADAVLNELAVPVLNLIPDVELHYEDLPSDPDLRKLRAWLWTRWLGCLLIYSESRGHGIFLYAAPFVDNLVDPIKIGFLPRTPDGAIEEPSPKGSLSAGIVTLWRIKRAAQNSNPATKYTAVRQLEAEAVASVGDIPTFYSRVLQFAREGVRPIVIGALASSKVSEVADDYRAAIEHLQPLAFFQGMDEWAPELAEEVHRAISRVVQHQTQAILRAIETQVSPNDIHNLVDSVLPLLNHPYSLPSANAAIFLAEGRWLRYSTLRNATTLLDAADKFVKALREYGKYPAPAEDVARTHAALGDIYLALFKLGDRKKARLSLDEYDKALQYFTADKDEWAAIVTNRIFVSLNLGLDSESLKRERGKLEVALTVFNAESQRPQRVAVLNTLGSLCVQMKVFADAAKYYAQIIDLTVGSPNLAGEEAAAMTNLARALRQMDGRDPAQLQREAIAWYRAALQLQSPREEFIDFWSATKYHLGQTYFRLYELGDDSAAQAALKEVDESIELLKKQDPFRKRESAQGLKRLICEAVLSRGHIDFSSCQRR